MRLQYKINKYSLTVINRNKTKINSLACKETYLKFEQFTYITYFTTSVTNGQKYRGTNVAADLWKGLI